MNIPFIDLKRFEDGFLDRWNSKVTFLSESASFIGGAEVQSLEASLAVKTNTKYAVSCANGTDAIQLALRAVGVGKDDHVLIPDSTFWATFEAVVNVGAIPSTVDVDLSDGGVDFEAFCDAVKTLKPKAAIIAHLYGWATSKLGEIRTFCQEHNVSLVEDGAQCFGVMYNGESIYKDALIATTSFYPAKVLGAAGDAGAVFTNDAELARKVRMYSNHGRKDHYAYEDIGWNSRMDTFQAAYLNLSLEYVDHKIASRVESANYFHAALKQHGITEILPPSQFKENGYLNVCLVPEEVKFGLQDFFKAQGVGFGNVYPSAMSEQECSRKYQYKKFGGDNSIILGKTVFNQPLFPYMKTEELELCVETLIKGLNTNG